MLTPLGKSYVVTDIADGMFVMLICAVLLIGGVTLFDFVRGLQELEVQARAAAERRNAANDVVVR